MKVSELKSICIMAKKVVGRNPILPILDNALIDNGQFHVTNLQTSVIWPVPFEGTFLVDFRTLYDILKGAGRNQIIDLQHSDKENKTKALMDGEQVTTLVPLDQVKEFPKIPNPKFIEKGTLIAQDVLNIQNMQKFATKDELRPAMEGVYINEHAVATDGHRLSWRKLSHSFQPPVILPKKIPQILDKKTDYEVSFDADGVHEKSVNHVMFQAPGITIITKTVDEKYPDWKAVVPDKNNYRMKVFVDKDQLIKMLNMALASANPKTQQVAFIPKPKGILLVSEDIDEGKEFNKEIYALKTLNDDKRIVFNREADSPKIGLDKASIKNGKIHGPIAVYVNENVIFEPKNDPKGEVNVKEFRDKYKIDLDIENYGREVIFGVNGKFMLDILKVIDEEMIEISVAEPNRAIIVHHNNLLMPVMLDSKYHE